MKSAEIRDAFLKFFESKGHAIVPSSSLIPGNDPTLLFTNAGMVQFKDVFLGDDKRPYTRAVSSQRCVRAGGKHNDLENVGYTARHHTFFEMLGNFSFGDYFKRETIGYAWEFLTGAEHLAIPKEKLWVTVYDEDQEAYDIWHKEIGVPAERIIRIGDNKGAKYASDNFWAMGDTGPCGPCSEIFYDHGPEVAGGPPGSPDEDGDRYIEIWNNVFMQFNRTPDGVMHPLPKPSVDTGMGLERISAVMQHVHSNYEIDLFQNLLQAAAKATGTTDLSNQSLRVIADHIRSCAFLVVDGIVPSNEGRGYVLRRIMRRAIRHGHKLGQQQPFFHTLVAALADEMGAAYPELVEQQAHITKVLLAEEEQFAKTLDKGMAVLDQALAQLKGDTLDGLTVFSLYDTYGFPVDLTADIARERGLKLDMAAYESAMQAQRERARAAGSFKVDYSNSLKLDGATDFTGYDALAGEGKVVAILKGSDTVASLQAGEQGAIVMDVTPFYAESGGQAGDTGYLSAAGARFEVQDCTKQAGHHIHHGILQDGVIKVGDTLGAEVDANVRGDTVLNHSATHLLHAALRKLLGEHVTQKGSLVTAERLRFDFSHNEAVKPAELAAIEQMVNEQVRNNSEVHTDVCDMEQAKAKGAMALFGEKYGDEVRVLSMGDGFSVELCGGTHVKRTGDIGLFRIVSEAGIASGVRRIEAVTGARALASVEEQSQTLGNVAALLKTSPEQLQDKTEQLVASHKALEKELAGLKAKLASMASGDLVSQARDVAGVKVLAVKLDGVDPKSLRDSADQLKNKLGSAVVLLATAEDGKVSLVASVTKDLTARLKAGDLMRHAAEMVGGKGGGRPDMAQGGGTDVGALPGALESAYSWVESQLS
ncbi:alanine--tRNA ligase [Simiduia agarivorans]|uniref:Alanine--tRNA ligase n=1 Tax=Simiduia agarivorans (strain DSM 21679 / JCM 13881 / BCRC 17597 / SA1) TaxID=1117647 RepID=K4KTG1_SIMAS|nr:alanine--tRNA ligase [Simiduia agarivorans]AFU97247.1 alanyl-tRNA ligase [Simiduia agarivorans SA1 = DSM 21679]